MGKPNTSHPRGTCRCWIDSEAVEASSTLPRGPSVWCGKPRWKDGYCEAHHPNNLGKRRNIEDAGSLAIVGSVCELRDLYPNLPETICVAANHVFDQGALQVLVITLGDRPPDSGSSLEAALQELARLVPLTGTPTLTECVKWATGFLRKTQKRDETLKLVWECLHQGYAAVESLRPAGGWNKE